jgi:hypothetical protein
VNNSIRKGKATVRRGSGEPGLIYSSSSPLLAGSRPEVPRPKEPRVRLPLRTGVHDVVVPGSRALVRSVGSVAI